MNKKINKKSSELLNNHKVFFQKNLKGFTLIELLVVIAIIGLLSSMAVVSLNDARKKARDAKRVSDMKQVQLALELYYNDLDKYPDRENLVLGFGNGLTLSNSNLGFENSPHGESVYMSRVPSNPQPAPVTSINYLYTAHNASGGACDNASLGNICTQYSIIFGLEATNINLGSTTYPCHASPSGMGCP